MSKITAMYIRLSMEDEDVSLNRKEESNSISSQRELLKAYIENHSELKDTKVQEYCDDGFTGTKFERPGYMKLMEDIRAEKISCIVVKDLSRLGRDYIEVGSLLEQILPLYQVRVIAVNDNYDSDNYDGSTGGMNVAFKNLIYMLYSRDLSNKICSAKHTRILNGENISGQLRYGYVKDPNDKHKIIVDPEAAEVVKLIFELTAQGKRKTEVANYLNAHGIDTPSAYKKRKGSKNFFHAVEVKSLWSTSSIHDILNDEVYLGKLIWNKTKKRVGSNNTSTYVPKDEWIVIENCHEPIITQKLFDTAHANSKKYIRPKRGKRNYNPFYYCGVCGRALVPSKRVSIPEIINGERKSEIMEKEAKKVAEAMSDYATAEKAVLLKRVKVISIIGLVALIIGLIMESICYDSMIPIYESIKGICLGLGVGALVTMVLYTTGILEKIKNKKSKQIKIVAGIGCAIMIICILVSLIVSII